MKKLKDYFRFNSRERLAIILLIFLMTFFWVLPSFYPSKSLPNIAEEQIKNSSKPQAFALDSTIPKSEIFRKKDKVAVEKPIKYFYFDPNKIDANQWQSLGLRTKTVQTIINYRNKGGYFKQPEDLRKIWGLRPEEADRLIPYVQITALQKMAKDLPTKKEFWSDSSRANKSGPLKKLNINTATEEEWRAFPGIGVALSTRIIKFRDKIGGFKSVSQVGKTYGIPDSVFQHMLPYLILDD